MTSRKSFLSPHSVGFAIWITAPWSHRFEKHYLIALEIQASLSYSRLKNIINGEKSEFLNPISQPTDAPTATTPQPTTDANATHIPLQHRTLKLVLTKAHISEKSSLLLQIQQFWNPGSTMWHSTGRSQCTAPRLWNDSLQHQSAEGARISHQ